MEVVSAVGPRERAAVRVRAARVDRLAASAASLERAALAAPQVSAVKAATATICN